MLKRVLSALASCVTALLILCLPGNTEYAQAAEKQCIDVDKLQVRIGPPTIVRGPAKDELDCRFNEIRLSQGAYRGFSSNKVVYRIDGAAVSDMGGAREIAIGRNIAAAFGGCGFWLSGLERAGNELLGFLHAEKDCSYRDRQTNKSVVLAKSNDNGKSWEIKGQIITGRDETTSGKTTGEGDCSIIDGKDGFYYAYCLRASDWRTIVARGPVDNPMPGQWKKYYESAWNEPGLGGRATSLGFIGTAAAEWADRGAVIMLGTDKQFGGLKLSIACDKVAFRTLKESLIVLDGVDRHRPAPTELVMCPSMLNVDDGSNQVGNSFFISHVYLQPHEDFTKRYLVLRKVNISEGGHFGSQVGIALSRWYNDEKKDRWTTTAPVPGNNKAYKFEAALGYLMTTPEPSLTKRRLDECVNEQDGHRDRILIDHAVGCGAFVMLRTAGWVYKDSQPNTLPLYGCYNDAAHQHFVSTRSDCEMLGRQERILGYALKD